MIVCCRRRCRRVVVVVVVGMNDHPLTTTIKQVNVTITNTIAILFVDDEHRRRVLFEQCMLIRIYFRYSIVVSLVK